MKAELTKRQTEVLNFLTRHISRAGYPPTLREIARHFGIKGFSAIKKHLDALEKKGHLTRGSGARAIEIADHPQSVSVPILGQVAAGKPILAEENILGTLALDRSMVRFSQTFLLKVKGDSMIEAGIMDGDHVLVKVQTVAENGEIVVALVDEEATVKRFFHRGDKIMLQPENPHHQAMTFTKGDNFRILGKVMGVIRLPGLF
ncbi:MAG TPA: transcriptional repressor LexA [Nitrospiria bacterium]|nr:transcriptional repressor LexA [Nitrospiria bacterium]